MKIRLTRNQYLRPCRSYAKCSWRDDNPDFSSSGIQSDTPMTLCSLHKLHCQSSVGTSCKGGSAHSKWNTAGQVSQHKRSPTLWHTRQ